MTERPKRRKLPHERQAFTHKFSLGGNFKCFITVGLFDDGTPGEIFLVLDSPFYEGGETISGMMDDFAKAISFNLQMGMPVEELSEHFIHTQYAPGGVTDNSAIPHAKSPNDYIFRWLRYKFVDAPPCSTCGYMTMRNGPVWKCNSCGATAQVADAGGRQ